VLQPAPAPVQLVPVDEVQVPVPVQQQFPAAQQIEPHVLPETYPGAEFPLLPVVTQQRSAAVQALPPFVHDLHTSPDEHVTPPVPQGHPATLPLHAADAVVANIAVARAVITARSTARLGVELARDRATSSNTWLILSSVKNRGLRVDGPYTTQDRPWAMGDALPHHISKLRKH